MSSLPQGVMIFLSLLPMLGLGLLAVVLLSLGSNRDRWILPGALAVSWRSRVGGAAMEYGPRVKALLNQPKPEIAEIDDSQSAPGGGQFKIVNFSEKENRQSHDK